MSFTTNSLKSIQDVNYINYTFIALSYSCLNQLLSFDSGADCYLQFSKHKPTSCTTAASYAVDIIHRTEGERKCYTRQFINCTAYANN